MKLTEFFEQSWIAKSNVHAKHSSRFRMDSTTGSHTIDR